jgi:hypothetical protein
MAHNGVHVARIKQPDDFHDLFLSRVTGGKSLKFGSLPPV